MLTKKEVLDLFKFLSTVYPQFEVNQYKIDTWSSLLNDQDFIAVWENAKSHVKENKFPPSIAELREQKKIGRDVPRDFVYDLTAGEDRE